MVASSALAALGDDVGGGSAEGGTTTTATELVCWRRSSKEFSAMVFRITFAVWAGATSL